MTHADAFISLQSKLHTRGKLSCRDFILHTYCHSAANCSEAWRRALMLPGNGKDKIPEDELGYSCGALLYRLILAITSSSPTNHGAFRAQHAAQLARLFHCAIEFLTPMICTRLQ